MSLLDQYFSEVQTANEKEITEHSLRSALETLLKATAKEVNKEIEVLQEPKRHSKFGTPDFKISNTAGIIGYCETKKIGENLDEVLKSAQIKKYLELNSNLLLTDYQVFIWIKEQAEVKRILLTPQTTQALENLLKDFFRETPQGIGTAKDLAKALAVRTRFLKESLTELLQEQLANHDSIAILKSLYHSLKEIVSSEITQSAFCDAYAQMLSYGLFLAKLNAEKDINFYQTKIDFYNAQKFLPDSFALIRELLGFTSAVDREYGETQKVAWVLNEILTIINSLNIKEIQKSLSFNKSSISSSEDISADPYLYFYEDFLGQYDSNLRKAKGVYYTPPAVVNFIVRAIDEVLKTEFGIGKGLADKEQVTVLDFATGTGTFILEILKVIFTTVPANSTLRPEIIKNHVLKNIYGFEYLIAPYTVAHLKLSQYLKDSGYELGKNEQFKIFLTDTLSPFSRQVQTFMPSLSKEGLAAQNVKEQPILIITGNPPYSGHSANKGTWISEKVNDYKKVGNERLDEKNPKWLQNDYVKFIRFAEWKMQQVEQGMVAIITDNSFLDNPTFRLMRKSLLQTFNKLYVVDLHGDSKKKEKIPLPNGEGWGGTDQNVFDIKQGVSISIFVKTKKTSKNKAETGLGEIYHTDFYGTRQAKFDLCLGNDLKTVAWKSLTPQTPFYLFKPQNLEAKEEYDKGWSVKEIFNMQGNGIITKRDGLATNENTQKLIANLKLFADKDNYSNKNIAEIFKLPLQDKDKWNLKNTRDYLDKEGIKIDKVVKYNYRPFSFRFLYFDEMIVARLVKELSKQFDKFNIGLVTGRAGQNVPEGQWNLCFITKFISDINLFYRGGATVFPLYYYNGNSQSTDYQYLFSDENGKKSNFTPKFKEFIAVHYPDKKLEAREIFDYIYAVLHSPKYRRAYKDFLQMDFPKIPFVESLEIFTALSKLGNQLSEAHLLENGDWEQIDAGMPMEIGSNEVKEIRYSPPLAERVGGRLYYNEKQYFTNVSPAVWEFQIGGYQVLEKYLKDRKGKNIFEELTHIERIIKILTFTLQKMQEIDTFLFGK
jgi:predicted helicase